VHTTVQVFTYFVLGFVGVRAFYTAEQYLILAAAPCMVHTAVTSALLMRVCQVRALNLAQFSKYKNLSVDNNRTLLLVTSFLIDYF
jgi:hypothetical protein